MSKSFPRDATLKVIIIRLGGREGMAPGLLSFLERRVIFFLAAKLLQVFFSTLIFLCILHCKKAHKFTIVAIFKGTVQWCQLYSHYCETGFQNYFICKTDTGPLKQLAILSSPHSCIHQAAFCEFDYFKYFIPVES